MKLNETEKRILAEIFRNTTLSRSDIAVRLGITLASVSNYTSGLLRAGMLVEQGVDRTHELGRNKVLLGINPNYAYLFGVVIEEGGLEWAFADCTGHILSRGSKSLSSGEMLVNLGSRLGEVFREQLRQFNISPSWVFGMGVNASERGETHGVVARAAEQIQKYFEKEYGYHVFRGSNVHGLCLAEYLLSDTGDDFVFLSYGPRVEAMLWLGGQPHLGRHGHGVNIAHLRIPLQHPGVSDPCAVCGQVDCLDSLVSYPSLRQRMRQKMGGEASSNQDPFHLLAASAREWHDAGVAGLLDDVAEGLAMAAQTMCLVSGCQRVVLFGEHFSHESFLPLVRERITSLCAQGGGVEVEVSKVPPKSKVAGALFTALNGVAYGIPSRHIRPSETKVERTRSAKKTASNRERVTS